MICFPHNPLCRSICLSFLFLSSIPSLTLLLYFFSSFFCSITVVLFRQFLSSVSVYPSNFSLHSLLIFLSLLLSVHPAPFIPLFFYLSFFLSIYLFLFPTTCLFLWVSPSLLPLFFLSLRRLLPSPCLTSLFFHLTLSLHLHLFSSIQRRLVSHSHYIIKL